MPVVEKALRTNSLKAPKKDWTLTIIALGYASVEILGVGICYFLKRI